MKITLRSKLLQLAVVVGVAAMLLVHEVEAVALLQTDLAAGAAEAEVEAEAAEVEEMMAEKVGGVLVAEAVEAEELDDAEDGESSHATTTSE